ncbi:MAG: hypothetical protein H7222_05510 [Methylotenera sp.]|nr:hypothetical protein [Oligoflexia bacterium]
MTTPTLWRPCSSCKKSIHFGTRYWVCNVSTCNRKRTGLIFCTVSCWDAHVPQMNHRESWAEEKKAPTPAEWAQILAEEETPKKRTPKSVPAPDAKVNSDQSASTQVKSAQPILRRPRSD